MYGQLWMFDEWMDASKATFEYDGDVISEVVYQYYEGGTWENQMKEVYNYNGDQWSVLIWIWNGNNWTSSEMYTYVRDSNVIEVLIQYMEGGAWQNKAKEIMTLDFDENVTEILCKEWNMETVQWENVNKTTYIYEGGVYVDQYDQIWDGVDWNDQYYYTFEYDGNGNAKHGVCFEFDGYTWSPATGTIDMAYGYNAEKKSFYCSEVEMVYVDLTSINENAQTANVKVYPVPAENEIFIQTDDFQKAEIYSLAGQKLMECLRDRMNVSTLSSGLYIMKVYDHEGDCATQRFMVK